MGGGGTEFFGVVKGGVAVFFRGDHNSLRVKEGGPNFFRKIFAPFAQCSFNRWGDQNFSPMPKGGPKFFTVGKGGGTIFFYVCKGRDQKKW